MIIAGISALSLSILTTAATFVYKSGSDPFTLVAARAAVSFLIACLFIQTSQKQIRFPIGNLILILAFSTGQLMINFGYMTSIIYIPVSFAVIIFYTFPVLVLFVEALIVCRVPKPVETISFVTAFVGLSLALAPSFDSLDWRGVTSASIASVGGVIVMSTGSRAAQRLGTVNTFFHMQLIAFFVTLIVMLGAGGPTLPKVEIGWWSLGIACLCYTIGILTQIIAVKMVDPASASLVYNLEPLLTLALAAWILTDTLTSIQYIGSALILAAILVAGRLATSPPP
ncbi:MAG: hypothetical protein CMF69_12525 [Magnetovibrio sp.]|nr:hypothetical protein [Magnetovibrio sp.]